VAAHSSRTVVRANGAPARARAASRPARRGRAQQRLAVVRQRRERRVRAVPLDHRELAAVVRTGFVGAPALANLDDARQAGRDQPLHVVLRRRDQPVAVARRHGVEVNLLAGRTNARGRVDLDEPLAIEPGAHGAQDAGARLQRLARRDHGGRLGAGEPLEVLAGARVDLDDVADVDEQRHVDRGAGRDLGGLRRARRGVAAEARVGLDDRLLDEVRQRDATARALKNSTSTLMFSGM
jgi:hypothetical protein